MYKILISLAVASVITGCLGGDDTQSQEQATPPSVMKLADEEYTSEQLAELLYHNAQMGCAQSGAMIARVTAAWDGGSIDLPCADLAEGRERGLIGALLGLAVAGVAYFAEDWCEEHDKKNKGTPQDHHCHKMIPAWAALTGFGLAFVF
jgi:hypothetical protein